ncbi:uncharacterized protein LOC101449838 isoform X2 [Ceratitis capitata]|uniref:(Mediterranean fruit fly) hypothetical protein n=1 Tax=Ceratitis capitata TaxID=7213 RepID=A0A811UF32_CERCA|nr:uncharacterized protein LOC101449838 isoform X2 [Ceratitis capitata]CAD6997474.1 unnamed protein product [Ceratitis capitata]
MCKFTNRLFVFTLLTFVARTALVDAAVARAQHRGAADAKLFDLLSLSDNDNNYDLHYDQRQKGHENLRVRMDGFFIEMPPEDEGKEELTEDLLNEIREELLLSLADADSKRTTTTESPDKPPLHEFWFLKGNKLETDHRAGEQQVGGAEGVQNKHNIEGRNAEIFKSSGLLGVNRVPEAKRVGVITKQHFSTLLNLLKHMRRN